MASVNEDHVGVVWCCVHKAWRLTDVYGDTRVSIDDAAIAAEDDVCHRGDVAAVVDVTVRRVASVVGSIRDQAHAQGALALVPREEVAA